MKHKAKLLLSPKNLKPSFKGWKILGVLNPGAIRIPNGKIIMYARIAEEGIKHKHGKELMCPVMASKDDYKEEYKVISEKNVLKTGKWNEIYLKDGTCILPHISHFRKITIKENGYGIEKIEHRPAFTGIPNESDYGVEDPRITYLDGKYYMTYVGVSIKEGVSTFLAESDDLINWNRLGLIFREQNKDVVLFPEKINGEYVALNRPETAFNFSKPGIWVSYSKDLIYWGKDKNIMRPRNNSWEHQRIGAGCPPIKTDKGWLVIYHGVMDYGSGNKYSAGAVLLDLKNPEKIIKRSSIKKALIEPDDKYEKSGFVNNVVFPTGVVP